MTKTWVLVPLRFARFFAEAQNDLLKGKIPTLPRHPDLSGAGATKVLAEGAGVCFQAQVLTTCARSAR